jgi:hypothetical protein
MVVAFSTVTVQQMMKRHHYHEHGDDHGLR